MNEYFWGIKNSKEGEEKSSDGNEEVINIPKDSNVINFFSDINNKTAADLCQKIDEKTNELIVAKQKYNISDINIKLVINSRYPYQIRNS